MPSKRVERVRYRRNQPPTFLHGHGVIQPGEFTEAIGVDEARRRAEFEVVRVPLTSAGDEPDDESE